MQLTSASAAAAAQFSNSLDKFLFYLSCVVTVTVRRSTEPLVFTSNIRTQSYFTRLLFEQCVCEQIFIASNMAIVRRMRQRHPIST